MLWQELKTEKKLNKFWNKAECPIQQANFPAEDETVSEIL